MRLTSQSPTFPKIQVRQRGAVREGIKRPCGPEQSKYRQRCQVVQVSDGLGGQRFKLAISGPRVRARTFEGPAVVAVDAREVLAVREGIQRPCGSEQSK